MDCIIWIFSTARNLFINTIKAPNTDQLTFSSLLRFIMFSSIMRLNFFKRFVHHGCRSLKFPQLLLAVNSLSSSLSKLDTNFSKSLRGGKKRSKCQNVNGPIHLIYDKFKIGGGIAPSKTKRP